MGGPPSPEPSTPKTPNDAWALWDIYGLQELTVRRLRMGCPATPIGSPFNQLSDVRVLGFGLWADQQFYLR